MRAIVAVLALAASGCMCWSEKEACVDEPAGRCWEQPVTECLDLTGDPDAEDDTWSEPESDGACGSTWLSGSCASQGYRTPCGDSWVRPGASC